MIASLTNIDITHSEAPVSPQSSTIKVPSPSSSRRFSSLLKKDDTNKDDQRRDEDKDDSDNTSLGIGADCPLRKDIIYSFLNQDYFTNTDTKDALFDGKYLKEISFTGECNRAGNTSPQSLSELIKQDPAHIEQKQAENTLISRNILQKVAPQPAELHLVSQQTAFSELIKQDPIHIEQKQSENTPIQRSILQKVAPQPAELHLVSQQTAFSELIKQDPAHIEQKQAENILISRNILQKAAPQPTESHFGSQQIAFLELIKQDPIHIEQKQSENTPIQRSILQKENHHNQLNIRSNTKFLIKNTNDNKISVVNGKKYDDILISENESYIDNEIKIINSDFLDKNVTNTDNDYNISSSDQNKLSPLNVIKHDMNLTFSTEHHTLAQTFTVSHKADTENLFSFQNLLSAKPRSLPTTLNMTIATSDKTPVHIQLTQQENNLAVLSLQGTDTATTDVLKQSKHDLIHHLDMAGIQSTNVKITILPTDTSNMNREQGNFNNGSFFAGYSGQQHQQNNHQRNQHTKIENPIESLSASAHNDGQISQAQTTDNTMLSNRLSPANMPYRGINISV